MTNTEANGPQSEITVRRATLEDAAAIGSVFDAAVRENWSYLGDLAKEPMFAPSFWDEAVADHAPPNAMLVALDKSGDIVGYTAVHPDGEMYVLFVRPSHSGRGVGRTLLSAALDVLRAAGCKESYLYVHEENKRAIAVYVAAGYRADGSVRESDFRGVQIRERRLVKLL